MNRSASSQADEHLERVAEREVGRESVINNGVNDHERERWLGVGFDNCL